MPPEQKDIEKDDYVFTTLKREAFELLEENEEVQLFDAKINNLIKLGKDTTIVADKANTYISRILRDYPREIIIHFWR